ncbi:acetyl-CoA carboxylase carboxyl transferase subunit beta [Actinoalloteichus hoggarensis]|uniref:Multifunctional fusion protein n=1 Tax=Actinoalloteichus hoggarensis TaxID=1470176 RepID=A0A221W1R5_9PSEU|nr:acetyl-CoA carboxylase, carboxyltransferase subunit beta [Actinoalloteichus hoggarensis]ASO19720.1 Acetyl-coenzyme A carboxylase carboxyl transferase subunit alpha [Actinoalloteichus hoggarensis]MBB5919573.1 acetyl-CoA carboxylase carboxyl transferase subunit beta [Actinoalloteichus hoggarensis]
MTSTWKQTTRAASTAGTESDWFHCRGCHTLIYRRRFDRLGQVCPECGRHGPLTARQRIDQLFDVGTVKPVDLPATVDDPLTFTDLVPYSQRLATARRDTGLDDAVTVVHASLRGHQVVAAIMDFRFLGGSLGTAAGEAITRAAETALEQGCPLLLITASGGARMQEGALSLMQMAKTSNAIAALGEAGLLTISLITDPTYGGVAASFATLSDLIIAEPGARMGFAGPRVIEQTIRQRLPEGFQTAEFLRSHGLIDDVRPRSELPHVLDVLLSSSTPVAADWGAEHVDPVTTDVDRLAGREIGALVATARHLRRPTTLDHMAYWMDGFIELHGDRRGADCPAVVGGIGLLEGLPVVVIGHQKGHTTAEMVRRGFGMPSPAGYRKAIRLMRLAARMGVPVVTLVDTPGADPGLAAEENNQAGAIAECLRVIGGLPVPVVSVITGEGGSGGAIALAAGDRVLLSENAIYSVISPEGCAAILWKSPEAASTAAAALWLDAASLLRLGVVDGVVPEPPGGAHHDPAAAAETVRDAVICAVRELRGRDGAELVAERRRRFRRFGVASAANDVKEIRK